MTREELLGIEGAGPIHWPGRDVRISLRCPPEVGMSVTIDSSTGHVCVEELDGMGGDGPDIVYLGRAATVADVERLVAALRGLGR